MILANRNKIVVIGKRLYAIMMLAVSLCVTSCNAQSKFIPESNIEDSLRLVQAQWNIDSLDGLILKSFHFSESHLFGAAQQFFLLELPPDSPRRIAFAFDESRAEVSQFAERYDALAAVNGSYFDMAFGKPICYLRIDGKELGENTPGLVNPKHRKYYQHAVITLSGGRPQLLTPDSARMWERQLPDSNVMTAGPMLLREASIVPQRDDRTFITHRHNRTALGIRDDGTVILLVADGRFSNVAEGLSIPELQLVMKWLGCRDAINLDGGGSSTIYVRDRGHDGVINYPSDNNKYDHNGSRIVSNAIVIL